MKLDKPIKMIVYPIPGEKNINGYVCVYDEIKQHIDNYNKKHDKLNINPLLEYYKNENSDGGVHLNEVVGYCSKIYEENGVFYIDVLGFIETHPIYNIIDIDTFKYEYAIGTKKHGYVSDGQMIIENIVGLYIHEVEFLLTKEKHRKLKIERFINEETD